MSFVLPPKVMALVLSLVNAISPGKSMYSRVEIPYCDASCQDTLLCENEHDWRCKKPKFEKYLYNRNLSDFMDERRSNPHRWANYKELEAEAKAQSFTRPETYEEALERYVIIAKAAYDVSRELSIRAAKDPKLVKFCKSEAKQGRTPDKCRALKSSRPWRWAPNQLMYMMITVAIYESGLRRDVHSGEGFASRGDCQWEYNKGHPKFGQRAPAWAKNAHRIPGTCRSVCLGQINLGQGKTPNGWTADDLVGIDYDSTRRCFIVSGRHLAVHRLRCSRSSQTNDWITATFTGYGTGGSCKINKAWPGKRTGTYNALISRRPPQNPRVQEYLDTLLKQNQQQQQQQNEIQSQLVSFSMDYADY